MPLHLQSIIEDDRVRSVLSDFLQRNLENNTLNFIIL